MKFPKEDYTGVYVSHGHSKTVFVIRSASRQKGKFDDAVLKIRRGQVDNEPAVMRQLPDVSPKVSGACITAPLPRQADELTGVWSGATDD